MEKTAWFVALAALVVPLVTVGSAHAAPPPPSSAHPRLFLTDALRTAFTANAAKDGTAAHSLVAACQETLDHPEYTTDRGGVDSEAWAGGALHCAFAYLATNNDAYRTQAIKFWHAALDDDQTMGDKLGCVQGVDTDWKNHWDGNYPPPPVLVTVTHDTGYPMRWYGPYLSLTYDWLYSTTGVDDALLAQTRTCLTAWMDWYSERGYLRDVAGMNYQAGFLAAKTLAAVAIGTDGGADGHLWNQAVDNEFAKVLVGDGSTWTPEGWNNQTVMGGLVGRNETALGKPYGAMVGGDWGSWEYGPLSVIEYAAATFALEKNGAPQPEMDAWVNSLAVRYIHATVPHGDAGYCGPGDCGDGTDNVNVAPNANVLDAVLLGPSSDQAASWAAFMKQKQQVTGSSVYNAIAETRVVTPADYTAQPNVPLWYLAHGTRTMYVRSSWQPDALWAAFNSAPQMLDHQHLSASTFIWSRGADHLIVDPAPYGGVSSWESNAITADSSVVTGDYAPSQTTWSQADLVWARGTNDAVYAARSDLSKAFQFAGTPSDIPYAHREWVLLPEGEVVTIDRVHTSDAARNMYVTFHTNTGGGGLSFDANMNATGTVGSSKVAIRPVFLSGGTPKITQPSTGDCTISCNFPCAKCDVARFAVDKYSVTVPGTWAVAVHVIDGLGASDALTDVGSINHDDFDPPPKQNGGIIGAAVYRAQKQSYIIASSAVDGVSPSTMTYGVPGTSAGRHVVFDAPEAADGTSVVTAAVQNTRCVVSITAGSGKGFTGRPLMFVVGAASDGCAVSESTGVEAGKPPPGGGTHANPDLPGKTASNSGGCSCKLTAPKPSSTTLLWLAGALVAVVGRRARRRTAR